MTRQSKNCTRTEQKKKRAGYRLLLKTYTLYKFLAVNIQLIPHMDGISLLSDIAGISDAMSIINCMGLKLVVDRKTSESYFEYIESDNTDHSIKTTLRYQKGKFTLEQRGSIHKLLLGNNSSDFPVGMVNDGIESLERLNKIDAVYLQNGMVQPITIQHRIKYLEIAVNIHVNPEEIDDEYITRNLGGYKGKPFIKEGITYKCDHELLLFKIYIKDKHLLRFEIRLKQTQLKRYGILSTSDLTVERVSALYRRLEKECREIIWLDSVNLYEDKRMTEEERVILSDNTHPLYQTHYKAFCKGLSKKERQNRAVRKYRRKKKAIAIMQEKGNGFGASLGKMIAMKIEELTGGNKLIN